MPFNLSSGVPLSVLALSSRFDGPRVMFHQSTSSSILSVLALSSRFDGLLGAFIYNFRLSVFQYSLCRVVLMVLFPLPSPIPHAHTFSTRSVESF